MRNQRDQYTKSKSHSAMSKERHAYLRPEKWIKELVFWNTPNHVQEKYEDFHQRMINEAGKRGRT